MPTYVYKWWGQISGSYGVEASNRETAEELIDQATFPQMMSEGDYDLQDFDSFGIEEVKE